METQFLDFFPYPLLVGVIVLVWTGLRLRKRGWPFLVGLALLGLYLLAVTDLLFFPLLLPQNWPANLSWQETVFYLTHRINLIPFYYGNLFVYTSRGWIHLSVPAREIVGNLLLTVPVGVGVPFLAGLRGRKVIWLALATGLALEGTQLLLQVVLGQARHVVDINDVLLNGSGVLVGYGLYRAAGWGWRRLGKRKEPL